jgi:hypothetical protein
MNKKGVFFTILAIFVSVMLVALFSSKLAFPVDSDVEINTLRISFFHDFNNDLRNSYLERALYVSVYNSLDDAVSFVGNNDFLILEAQYNLFVDNCLKGITPSYCDDEASFAYWADIIKDKVYDDFGINFNYSITGDVYINQTKPFSIFVSIPITYELSDDFVNRLWDSTIIETEVSITGLKDPLLLKKVGIDRVIYRDPIIEAGMINNPDPHGGFLNHYNDKTYIMSDFGPSFLMRLQGLTDSSDQGIQTLLTAGTVDHYNNMSYVDYMYIEGVEFECGEHPGEKLYNVVGIDADFRISWVDTVTNYNLGGADEIDIACG